MALFNLTRWPSVLVFLLAGMTAITFAFVTVNLFSQAMANVDFLRKFGAEAIRHGALVQVVELCFWGGLALICWVVFKTCEQILVERYMTWANRQNLPTPTADEQDQTQPTQPAPKGES